MFLSSLDILFLALSDLLFMSVFTVIEMGSWERDEVKNKDSQLIILNQKSTSSLTMNKEKILLLEIFVSLNSFCLCCHLLKTLP